MPDIVRLSRCKYWSLRAPEFWGDYGAMLAGGMLVGGDRDPEKPVLMRVGPFCPPISRTLYSLVATSVFAERIAQRFSDVELVPIVKGKIVDLRWETWDRTCPRPPLLPCTGEPEDYIELLPHSQSASAEMGDLYEVVPPDGGACGLVQEGRVLYTELDLGSLTKYSLFSVNRGNSTVSDLIVSDDARSWFEGEAAGWLDYRIVKFRRAWRRSSGSRFPRART